MNVCSRFFLFVLFFLPFQAAVSQEWATKMFTETSHDFGVVARGTKCEYRFEFKNPYKEDVRVIAVRSSCGCTTPVVTKSLVKTHEKSAILAKFNTSSFIGQKAATITVVLDRPYRAEVRLRVRGFIRTDIVIEPAELAFGEIPEGSSKKIVMKVSRQGRRNWRITDVRSECTDLGVRLKPPRITQNAVVYEMTVRVKETAAVGELRSEIILVTNQTNFPSVQLSVSGRVRPRLSVNPFAWNLGSLFPKSTAEKRLMVRGDQAFELKKVECSDKRFSFTVPEGKKKIHFVTAKFTSSDVIGKVSQSIQIISDLPGDASAECVASGEIKPSPKSKKLSKDESPKIKSGKL